MFRYFDPSRKKDRDHDKIVADNKRDERIAKEVRDHFAKNPYRPTQPGDKPADEPFDGFSAQRVSARREAMGLRRSRRSKPAVKRNAAEVSPGKARKAKRRKNKASPAPRALPPLPIKATAAPKPDHSARLAQIAIDLDQLEAKLENLIAEQERTFDDRRTRLLGERIGHLKTKRLELLREQGKLW